MGILNVTPDSFFDGGKYAGKTEIIGRVEQMVREGVDIVDVGGMSTRPGAGTVDEDEELRRVLSALEVIGEQFPGLPVSVDTFRAAVAEKAVQAGACMINDISGGTLDEKMFETVAHLNVPYVLMHIKGTPETMQQQPISQKITEKVIRFFDEQVAKLKALGFDKIILDPGFGFGKTLECNYVLLKELRFLKLSGRPLLVGVSRKSMINKVLGTTPDEALNGTSVLHTLALLNGADILRVHDVKEAVEAVRLVGRYNRANC